MAKFDASKNNDAAFKAIAKGQERIAVLGVTKQKVQDRLNAVQAKIDLEIASINDATAFLNALGVLKADAADIEDNDPRLDDADAV